MMKRKIPTARQSLAVFFACAVLLRVLYALIVPLNQAPDELRGQFYRVYYHAIGLRYPTAVGPMRYLYTPLYYWLNGFILAAFVQPPFLSTYEMFLRAGPYLRIESLLFSLITLCIGTMLIRRLYPRYALCILPVFYLMPLWVGTSFWVNMDSLFQLSMLLIICFALSVLTQPYRQRWPMLLGIFAGIILLIKPVALMVWIGIAAGIWYATQWKRERKNAIVLYSSASVVVSGWWFITNIPLLPWFISDNSFFTRPFSFPFYPLGLGWWTVETFFAAWGPTNNIRLPLVVYIILLSATVWILWPLRRRSYWKPLMKTEAQRLLLIMLGTMTVASILIFLCINTFISFQPQGRYLYPLFLLFPLCMGYALYRRIPEQFHLHLVWSITAILLLLNIWGLHCIRTQSIACVYHRVHLPEWKDPIVWKDKMK